MEQANEIEALDLAALLCSRVCHDVISPVGAITNGLEVLEDEDDAEMQRYAMELIQKSATQASSKLQFARLAFGAAGSAGASLDLNDAKDVAMGFVSHEKAEMTWEGPSAVMPKDLVKLLLNMILIALAAIPRGGSISLEISGDPERPTFSLVSKGINARVPTETDRFLNGRSADDVLDARAIQPYFTGLVARECEMDISAEMDGEDFRLIAKPRD
ncbi:MAG: histidine phosphotransferase [Parvibaculum sp.]|jgi:histidine phosphotransferase ChpT|nr:histidine phosphotransferase [Parvibaculum sp.]|tara:strand:- start:7546 stop:8193 length:648 start_codon:yes stop_codon:yes gene_type:complete